MLGADSASTQFVWRGSASAMRRVLTVACVGCVWIGAVEAEAAVIAFEGFGASTLFGEKT